MLSPLEAMGVAINMLIRTCETSGLISYPLDLTNTTCCHFLATMNVVSLRIPIINQRIYWRYIGDILEFIGGFL